MNQFFNMGISFAIVAGLLQGCSSDSKKTQAGVGIGAATGAVIGAVIGHQTGNREKGAAIGAVLGGTVGGVVGHRLDKQAKELEKIAETKRTEQGIVTQLKSDILFESGKSDLKSQATSNITSLGDILKKYPENVITVKGHTDSQGSDAQNKTLSEMRAGNVRDQLVKAGVPAGTISIVGMGESTPVADNSTSAGRAKNRRVEIEIAVDESKVPKEAK